MDGRVRASIMLGTSHREILVLQSNWGNRDGTRLNSCIYIWRKKSSCLSSGRFNAHKRNEIFRGINDSSLTLKCGFRDVITKKNAVLLDFVQMMDGEFSNFLQKASIMTRPKRVHFGVFLMSCIVLIPWEQFGWDRGAMRTKKMIPAGMEEKC